MKVWHVVLALLVAGLNGIAEEASETAMAPVEEVITESAPVAETTPVGDAITDAETEAPSEPAAQPAVAKPTTFVVLLPERIDLDWYWILYTDVSQHIVQSAIEKALIRAGLEVIDLNTIALPSFGNDWQRIMSVTYAVDAGRAASADYVITGQATAVKASEGFAYGVNVYRSQAEITAKIVRVRDGKIMEIEDASQLEGGQSAQAAGQSALKKAGAQVASKIARAASALAAAP